MKSAFFSPLRAWPRRILAVSIASLALVRVALGDVSWSGTVPASTDDAGEDDIDLFGNTLVILSGTGPTLFQSSIENFVFNSSTNGVTTLTVNNIDATKRTLAAGATILGTTNGMSLVVSGSADFRTGSLANTGSFSGLELVKNGGTGELIIDGLDNLLTGVTLKVLAGTMSIEGGGGTDSPISTLGTAIRIDGATAKLRFGTPSGPGTTFGTALSVNESGTLEHTTASADVLTGTVTLASGKTLTANVTAGSLRLTGNFFGGGNAHLTKTGAGTLTLSGGSAGLGVTTVSAGTLQYGSLASLYGGTTTSWTPANINVAGGATLAVNVGGAGEFTPSHVATLLGQLSTVSNNGLKAGSTVGFDTTNAAGPVILSNAITNSSGAGGGAVGIAKLGTGTLSLAGANTFSGATNIRTGTLALSASGSLANSSGIILASGATYDVSAVSGYTLAQPLSAKGAGTTQVVGGFNAGAQTINLQDGASIGALAFSSTLTLSGATLKFDLATVGSDQLSIGSTLTLSGTNIINVAALNAASALAEGAQAYTLITAGGGWLGGSFSLSSTTLTIGATTYHLSLSTDPTHQYLGVTTANPVVPATYTLTTSASAHSIHAITGSSAITTTLTHTGTTAASSDPLAYTSLGSTVSPIAGTTLGSPAPGSTLAPNAAGTANASAAQTFSSAVAGSFILTATGGTVTNSTLGGLATLQGTAGTDTVNVFRLAAASTSPLTFLGNHHVGDVVATQALSITNTAAADSFSEKLNAVIAGTTGGVTGGGAVNLLAAGASDTASLLVGLDTSSVGAKSGTVTLGLTSNGAGTSGLGLTGLSAQIVTVNAGSVFRLAAADAANGPLTFLGNHHVGDVVGTQALTVTNSAAADSFSEKLDAAISGTMGGVTASGVISLLAAGATNSSSLLVGLDTSAIGDKSGTITIALSSNGSGSSGLGMTGLSSQTVTVNAGTVFRLASAGGSGSPLTFLGNHHVGDVVGTQALTVTNSAAADSFSEKLDAAISGTTGGVTASGLISLLAAGTSNSSSLLVGLDTSTVGDKSGTVTLGLTSNGGGTSGLGLTVLSSQTVAVNAGSVFRLAAAGAAGGPLTFLGNHRVGDVVAAQALTITNSANADTFSEKLDALVSGTNGGVTATGVISLLAPGASDASSLLVGLDTSSVGDKSGTVTIGLTSNGATTSGLGLTGLSSQIVAVNAGSVFRLGAAGATGGPLTFLGNHHVGDVVAAQALTITNSANADTFSEKLDALISGMTGGVTATGVINLLAAGATDTSSLLVGLDTSTVGDKSGTVTVGLTSNGTGTSGLGSTALAGQIVTVNAGAVFRLAAPNALAPSVTLANVHVGESFGSAPLSIANLAVADGFSEGLNALPANLTGGASAAGSLSNVAGSSSAISVGLGNATTAAAGSKTGSVDVLLLSSGTNSGLADTALATQAVTISGGVYNLAAANMLSATIDLGRVRLNGSFGTVMLSATNLAAAGVFTEGLNARFGAASGAATHNGGTITNLAGGTTDSTALAVGLGGAAQTGAAGAVSGTVAVTLESSGTNSGLGETNLAPQLITVSGFVYSGLGVWNFNGSGTWAGLGNWQANGGVPGLDAGFNASDTATFAAAATSANPTVSLAGVSPNLKALTFDNADFSYTLESTGGGMLKLDNALATAMIVNSGGDHLISAPLELESDTSVAIATAGDELTLSGLISETGARTLTKTGPGTLNLEGQQNYSALTAAGGTTNLDGSFTGGTATITANATTNINASQALAALHIADGVVVTFGSGPAPAWSAGLASAAPVATPEPTAMGLLLVGALGLGARRRRR